MSPTISRVRAGQNAKYQGSLLEDLVMRFARRAGLVVWNIPQGAKFRRASAGVIPVAVQTPCDFTFTSNGITAFVDTKSVDGQTFTFSQVKEHQLQKLLEWEINGCRAGYLIWFRKIDRVIFFTASTLVRLRRRESLKPEDGEDFGSSSSILMKKLLIPKNPTKER